MFFVDERDAPRLAAAEGLVTLVGGYAGQQNYGDILQLVDALDVLERWDPDVLRVPVVGLREAAAHRRLVTAAGGALSRGCTVFWDPDPDAVPAVDGLVRAERPAPLLWGATWLYGGGYLNARWGPRKMQALADAEALAGGLGILVTSGLQVSSSGLEESSMRSALERAERVGVRDESSLELVREALPAAAGRLRLDGDDATRLLARGSAPAVPTPPGAPVVVNLHASGEDYVTGAAGDLEEFVAALLVGLHDELRRPLELQLVVAFQDEAVDELPTLERIAARVAAQRPSAVSLRVVRLLDDALHGDLAATRRAALTVACSYHVTLTSLLVGIPVVGLVANNYYRHKHEGLRRLFDLPAELVTDVARTSAAEAARVAAAYAVGDGHRRVLSDRLLAAAARLVAARAETEREVLGLLAVDRATAERHRGALRSAERSAREFETAYRKAEARVYELEHLLHEAWAEIGRRPDGPARPWSARIRRGLNGARRAVRGPR